MFRKILMSLFVLFPSFIGYTGTIVEKDKIIVSNDFEVVSNAVFSSNVTIRGYSALTADSQLTSTILNYSNPGTDAGTVTVTRANGTYMAFQCTNNTTITSDISGSDMYMFRLDLNPTNFSVTWDTNYFNATNAVITSNQYNILIGVRPYGGGRIEIR